MHIADHDLADDVVRGPDQAHRHEEKEVAKRHAPGLARRRNGKPPLHGVCAEIPSSLAAREPQGGVGLGEGTDLVVDQTVRLGADHDLDILDGRRLSLAGDDPQRALGSQHGDEVRDARHLRDSVGAPEQDVEVAERVRRLCSLSKL